MRKNWKELLIFGLQIGLFYLVPLTAKSIDALGMVFLIMAGTLLLGVAMGMFAGKLKYLYPFATAGFFLPTVFLYYNESALIHAVWYLLLAGLGVVLGVVLRWLWKKRDREE